MWKVFITLASKLTILKINPIALLTPPPSTKGGGNLILPIWQKNLIFSHKTFVESFITLASKLILLKINPIALLTPVAPMGEGIQFRLFGEKKLYLALKYLWKVS